MNPDRPYAHLVTRLRETGLRPTRQRLALAKLLFEQGERHVTAESLHGEALAGSIRVSLATVYNTLHQFTQAGLLRQVVVDGARTYFDTNTRLHHHFFIEDDGELVDFPGEGVTVSGIPETPDGTEQTRVDVVVRVSRQSSAN